MIPQALLEEADKDPMIAGFVYPHEQRNRVPIQHEGQTVGFFTPREDNGVLRTGAIYVQPAHRGKGLASSAIRQYVAGKPARALIETGNEASRRAFVGAGFTPGKPAPEHGGQWYEHTPVKKTTLDDIFKALKKGDVVQFPGNSAPAQAQEQPQYDSSFTDAVVARMPKLGSVDGGGETTAPKAGHLQSVAPEFPMKKNDQHAPPAYAPRIEQESQKAKAGKAASQAPDWNGRPILDAEHHTDLEQRASIHEFQDKLPRHEAEEKAHHSYRREHHLQGAAHHLLGMKAAHSMGNLEESKKHGAMYALHAKALGFDPYGEPPPDIRRLAEDPERQKIYRFKAHKSDLFLLDGGEPTQKAEVDFLRFRPMLKALDGTRIGKLVKGDVIDFQSRKQAIEDKRDAPAPEEPSEGRQFARGLLDKLNSPNPMERINRGLDSVLNNADGRSNARHEQMSGRHAYYNPVEGTYVASDTELDGPALEQKRSLMRSAMQHPKGNYWLHLPPGGGERFISSTPEGVVSHFHMWRAPGAGQPTQKNEPFMKTGIEDVFALLAKGDVVKFPGNKAPSEPKKDLGKPASVTPIAPKQQERRQEKSKAAFDKLDSLFSTIASDPGMKELARKKQVEEKAKQLKRGGKKFKVGDKVVCNHTADDGPNDCSYPWVGTVSGYESGMDTDDQHGVLVEWEHTKGHTGQGVHTQDELDLHAGQPTKPPAAPYRKSEDEMKTLTKAERDAKLRAFWDEKHAADEAQQALDTLRKAARLALEIKQREEKG